MSDINITVDTTQVKAAKTTLNELVGAVDRASRSATGFEKAVERQAVVTSRVNTELSNSVAGMNRFANTAGVGSRRMSELGVVTQQAGYQVGDFLVQIQSGTNWLVAFGQQATQLVGVLPLVAGNLGLTTAAAIGLSTGLGIGIPLVTALAAVFMRTAGTAETFTKSLEALNKQISESSSLAKIASGDMSELSERFGTLSVGIAALVAAQGDVQLRKLSDAAKTLNAELTAMYNGNAWLNVSRAEDLGNGLGLGYEKARQLATALEDLKSQDSLGGQIQKASDLRTLFLGMVGSVDNMTSAQFEFYSRVVDTESAFRATKNRADEMAGASGQVALEVGDVRDRLESAAKYAANLASIYFGNIRQAAADAAVLANNMLQASLNYGKFVNKGVGGADAANRATQGLRGTVISLGKIASGAGGVYESMGKSAGGAGGAVDDLAKSTEQLAKEIEKLEFDADPVKNYNEELKKLNELQKAGLSNGAYRKGLADANEELLKSVPIVGDLSSAFEGFLDGSIKSFKDFTSRVLGDFRKMLAEMIVTALRNKIFIPIVAGGTGIAGAAGASPMGGLGGLGGILGSFGGGSGIAGLAGGTGFLGGLGNVIGGFASGGFGGAFSAIGTALSGATSGLAGLATAAGALVAPLAVVAAAVSFFKKKVTELDAGISLSVKGMDTVVKTFSTKQTKRFWGLSKKTRTSESLAGASVADPIENSVASIQNSILDMAKTLNIGSETFDNFAFSMRLSLKGMTEEQQIAAVTAELTNLSESFTNMIPTLTNYKVAGETSVQTLTRLIDSLNVANYHFNQLTGTMIQTSLAGAGLASEMVLAFGGIEAFNSQMNFFTQNFYSEAEQIAMASDRVNAAFASMGMQAPATAEAFRQLVESLMKSVAAGVAGAQYQLAKVMSTQADLLAVDAYKKAEAAKAQTAATAAANATAAERYTLETKLLTVQGNTAALRARELALLDPTNRALQTTIWGLEDAKVAADKAAAAAAAAKAKADAIAQERYNLETQLLELQGNTAALRARELALLHPTNRALQIMIWKLEDAKKAIEGINEIDFATKVDYLRAIGLAKNSSSIPTSPVVNVNQPVRNANSAEREKRANERESNDTLTQQALLEVVKYTKRTYDVFRQWENDGLPAERV